MWSHGSRFRPSRPRSGRRTPRPVPMAGRPHQFVGSRGSAGWYLQSPQSHTLRSRSQALESAGVGHLSSIMEAKGATLVTDAAKPESLRQRKRTELYDRIVRGGHRLFLEHGYETTTVEMIAKEADFSPRTFFNSFPSKEDVR